MDNYGIGAAMQAPPSYDMTRDPQLKAQYFPPTDRKKLQQKRDLLQVELDNVNAAIAALDAHPDLEEFTKVLQRALRAI